MELVNERESRDGIGAPAKTDGGEDGLQCYPLSSTMVKLYL